MSTVLTLALVFSVVASAPFSISAAEADGETVAAEADGEVVADGAEAPFGALSDGRFTLTSTTYQLTADFAAQGYLYVPSDATAVIDLNGHTVSRNLSAVSETGYIILNEGTLTIEDSGTSGTITGGKSTTGGAIYNTGTLTVNGGSVTGNYADGDGGAVYNGAELYISGGTFTHNYAESQGGAVLNNGVLNMSGGTVKGNYAASGSGVYVRSGGAALNVSGRPVIIDNAGSNLWLAGNSMINILVALIGARIDISGNINRQLTNGLGSSSVEQFTFADGFVSAKRQNGEVYPDLPEATTVSNWSELKNAVKTNNSTIALTANITNSSQESNIEPDGKTLTIDLRGHYIDMNRKNISMSDDGHFMYVKGGSKITFIDSYGGGYITGGNGTDGGVFHVSDNSGSVLKLYNITLKDNIGKKGGAIRSDNQLYLYGCAITGNTAENGGAVFVKKDKSFNAWCTAFIGNKATSGSGGAVYSYGNVDMNYCLISGNTASQRGGALYNGDDATAANLTDTVINNNTANYGGAVFINTGTVNLTGCTVIGNKSNNSGGAVFSNSNADYSLAAESTLFKGNSAGTNGGAINALTNILLNDCTITGNTARYSGRGVCLYGTMAISGKNVISGNGKDNVYLATNSDTDNKGLINRIGSISDQTQIGIKADDYDRYLVIGLASKSEGDYFVLDDTNTDDYELTKTCGRVYLSYFLYVKKTAKVSVSSWTEMQNAINSAEYETLFTLTQTLNANGASTMRIPDGKTVVINLNGFNLNRGLTKEGSAGHVIQMKGDSTLTIRDTSANQSGKITGGWAEHGGGINVDGDCTLNIESGNISGNHAKYGGVYVADNGTCNMSGGKVTGNIASQDGGGIFADYPVTVTGGTISGNSAKYGGGYYFDEPGMTAELSGVTISGNTASEKGGGIYVWHGTVDLSEGVVVRENTAKKGGGACVTDKCTLTAENATFTKNKATENGGAIYNDENLTLTSCTITENEA